MASENLLPLGLLRAQLPLALKRQPAVSRSFSPCRTAPMKRSANSWLQAGGAPDRAIPGGPSAWPGRPGAGARRSPIRAWVRARAPEESRDPVCPEGDRVVRSCAIGLLSCASTGENAAAHVEVQGGQMSDIGNARWVAAASDSPHHRNRHRWRTGRMHRVRAAGIAPRSTTGEVHDRPERCTGSARTRAQG